MAADATTDLLLRKSIKWRTAAGWVMVTIIAYRYILHPVVNAILIGQGHEPMPALEPISWEDVMAIVGLPVGGAFADRMKDE